MCFSVSFIFCNITIIVIFHSTDKIYITGGFDGHDCLNTAEVYDPNTNQWTMITAMRSRRSGVSCISYHGHVYVIGIKMYLLRTKSYYCKTYTQIFV